MRFVGFAGSLREKSYNRAALRVAAEVAPSGVEIEIFDLAPIPIYNDDVRLRGYPPPVAEFRSRIAQADALLIVSPEYNYSTSGVLKNAIDWASRPPDQPFNGKPIAIMGASMSLLGTARAQYHVRQMFVFLNAYVLNQPEVMIAQAHQKFDEQGKLKDNETRERIRALVQALVDWTVKLRSPTAVA
jgi:chromate reductase, NAD(P)H dehydrogenase (quinone)